MHLGAVRYLYDHPEGLDPPVNARHCTHVKDCKDFSAVVAKAGDVILLHGLLPHTASPNYLHYARVISNPHVCLHSPYNLNRSDGNYVSLCVNIKTYLPANYILLSRACWSRSSCEA